MGTMRHKRSSGIQIAVCVLACLVASCSFATAVLAAHLASGVENLFSEACQAYNNNDFAVAAQKYQQVLDSGHESGETLYNLGNCYFRMGKLGLAMVHYERARKFMPRDHNVLDNIALVESRIVDKIGRSGFTAVAQTVCAWHYRLTGREVSVLFIGANVLFWVCLGILVSARNRFVKAAVLLAALFLVISGSSYALKEIERRGPGSAIVTAAEAEVKTGPGNYAVKFTIHEGTRIKLVESRDTWYQVCLADGKRGWIERDKVERI